MLGALRPLTAPVEVELGEQEGVAVEGGPADARQCRLRHVREADLCCQDREIESVGSMFYEKRKN